MKATTTISDYYAFGSPMPTRVWSDPNSKYKYGFNGKEKDDDINVNGGDYDFGARIYDSRLGRWLSLDPLMMKYPNVSGYIGMGNNPILFIDADGREIKPVELPISYSGPKTVLCTGDIAKTIVVFTEFRMNSNTGGFDFIYTYRETRSKSFSELLTLNNGLLEYVEKHENEHKNRYHSAAKKEYNYLFNNVPYFGKLDAIYGQVYAELEIQENKITEWFNTEEGKIDAIAAADQAAGVNYDVWHAKYAESIKKLRNDKTVKMDELSANRKKVKTELEDLFANEVKLINVHDGPGGVNPVSEITMTPEAKNLSNGTTKVVNQNGTSLENCPTPISR